jgi:hypothetical protein
MPRCSFPEADIGGVTQKLGMSEVGFADKVCFRCGCANVGFREGVPKTVVFGSFENAAKAWSSLTALLLQSGWKYHAFCIALKCKIPA